ncbi:class A beta-lactamase-related serine hydrolase, partial [Fulvivirga sp. RKSG066]|uniref:serine hydrolase domain-containing protein n=1 Tax=Fulvivirga aurantia TaxID=2529383 RepID=UPI0012BCDA64
MKTLILFAFIISGFVSQAQIQEIFEREALYQQFNGVVLVKENDSLIFEGCYHSKNENFSTTTAFDVGSITKQFTALAILQMVQQQKLNLDDPINLHLGEYGSQRWKKINIHHLLTHTSGIPSLFQTEQGLEMLMPDQASVSKSQLINHFKEAKLLFSPGEEFGYSNSGYLLLAIIIEHISGLDFVQYL